MRYRFPIFPTSTFLVVTVAFLTLTCAVPALATTAYWTGSAGDHAWSNPGNWNTGAVPTVLNDVVIPLGTPSCNTTGVGQIAVKSVHNLGDLVSDDHILILAEDFYNDGFVDAHVTLEISAPEGWVENNNSMRGTIINISAGSFGNAPGSVVETSGYWEGSNQHKAAIWILLSEEFVNEGQISANSLTTVGLHGLPVVISVDRSYDNWGSISGSSGGDGGDGGGVDLRAACRLTNHPGSEVTSGSEGGGRAIVGWVSAFSDSFIARGFIRAGKSDEDDQGTGPPRSLGSVEIMSRFVEVGVGNAEGRVIEAAGIHIRGQHLVFHDMQSFASVYSYETDMHFNTPPSGTADFSGVHTEGAFFAWQGTIHIHGNDVIEPPEGLDYVINPPPVLEPADESLVAAAGYLAPAFAEAGEAGTVVVKMQNLSTAPRVLNYAITSTEGWISPLSGTTVELPPFEFGSVLAEFTIPAEIECGQMDSVVVMLSISPEYERVAYGAIRCAPSSDQGVDDWIAIPPITLDTWPNPFRSQCALSFDQRQTSAWEIRVLDPGGRLVWSRAASGVGTGAAGAGSERSRVVWRPDACLASGAYWITLTSGAQANHRRVTYMK